jgi:rare lipoprotein A
VSTRVNVALGLLLLAGCAPRVSARLERSETGLASYYAASLNGHRTASGEIYRPENFTAAHRSLPFGSCVEVRATESGRAVQVRINDRGPHVPSRVIDLSWAAAAELHMLDRGVLRVQLQRCP